MSCASDLMTTDLVTVRPDMSLLHVQHLFVALQIGGAPVVDGRGHVVGVISSNDLMRAADQVCDADIDPTPRGNDGLPERLSALSVRDVATPDAVWVAPDAAVAYVAKLMRTEGIHRVLVGAPPRLDGILTAFDLLAALEE